MSSPAEKSTSGGGGMSMNTVTTVMAFSVSAFFVLFIFVRLLCARIHLRAGQSAAAAAAAHGDAFPAFSVRTQQPHPLVDRSCYVRTSVFVIGSHGARARRWSAGSAGWSRRW